MAREPLVFNYSAMCPEPQHKLKLMDPPKCPTDLRYERWMRDATRIINKLRNTGRLSS